MIQLYLPAIVRRNQVASRSSDISAAAGLVVSQTDTIGQNAHTLLESIKRFKA